MLDLAPGYISALATQVGFLSAFLGGFAATLFGVLLTTDKTSRAGFIAIMFAAIAAIGFIVGVLASTQVINVAHPEAPAIVAKQSITGARLFMGIGFELGAYALMVSIAAAGWLRSRATGIATTIIAIAGAVMMTLAQGIV